MVKSLKVDVNPKVFKWLRESSGWSKEDIAKRLNTNIEIISAIEKGERQPTLRQLKDLAIAFKRPLASFLLSEPLKESPLPKDYRMLLDRKNVFDKKTIYTIRKARDLQEIGAELLININNSTKPDIKKITITENPEKIALEFRDKFELDIEIQKKFKTSYEFFNNLRDIFEEMNILVFQFSMPIEDARGFALTDELPNVIVINSGDTIEARLFSLMHEFGHILLGETVIDLPNISISTDHKIERWCNQFASEFLLPSKEARKVFESEGTTLTDSIPLNRLSRKYKVSKSMLCYKMFNLKFITMDVYKEILNRYKPSDQELIDSEDTDKEKKGGGIPSDKKCLSEIGNKFVSIVANNYERNFITYTDALNFLSIKSKNFNQVLAKAKK
jgi:Zn-dependent peptidase ImmA (M78 family)/DNA-binding XRE family transcriptional regulator